MHPLTKVFVVLMTVLSVVLVSLVVPFVANTEKYRDQRDAAVLQAKAAEANAAVAQNLADASRSELIRQIDGMQQQVNAERSLNASLKGELGTIRGDLERSRADLIRTQADIANLTAANKQYADIQVDLQKELQARREENTKMARQIIDIEAANADSTTSTATLRRQLRVAQENLVQAQEELAELNEVLRRVPQEVLAGTTPGAGSDSEDNRGTVSVVPINTQVSQVTQAGDTTLVQLASGSAGGVKERMRFQISRDGEYMGTVVVMTVDEQAAVARVSLMKSGASIKAGDKAFSGPIN